ncbi:hypothetical protein GCM10028806_28140 [Spirosoma terrae]
MDTFGDRLKYLLDIKKVTPYMLAKEQDLSAGTLSRAINNKHKATKATIISICNALLKYEEVKFTQVEVDWLVKGEGKTPQFDRMGFYKPKISKEPNPNDEVVPLDLVDETAVTTTPSGSEFRELDNGSVLLTIPLVPEYAYASYAHGWKDPEYLEELPKYSIVLPQPEKGRFRAFEVKGDSMNDNSLNAICHGDVAIGKFIEPDHWGYKLYTNGGTDYVIATHDGLIIKRIVGHNIKEGIITCASKNPDKNEYPTYEVRLSEVYELYIVRKVDRDWTKR